MSKYVYLDFEFHSSNEPDPTLVSIAYVTTDSAYLPTAHWLHDKNFTDWKLAKTAMQKFMDEGYTFVAYAAESEARCLLTLLGHNLPGIKMIDLYLEYRNLLNHNHQYMYGRQLINGKIVNTTPPPDRYDTSPDTGNHSHPQYGLAAACFKLLNKMVDTAEKDTVRDIIISADKEAIEASKDRILKYNLSDIRHLPALHERMEITEKEALTRGEYAVATAKMVKLGYPVNVDKIRKLASNTAGIMALVAEDCTKELKGAFSLNKKTGLYVCKNSPIRAWIESQNIPNWPRTPKGAISLAEEKFTKEFDAESPGFAGAFVRYLKTKKSLNGFTPAGQGSKRKSFWESVGSDSRVRPYFGIYGSQSSRSQPSTTGFLPLKAKWMRNFIEAPRGRALASVDYSSQEFLVSAILSQDENMMSAYASGDVYLAFGKSANLIPQDGTKATHKILRDVCKALVLGISYDMTAKGLAPRLTAVAGRLVTEVEAQGYIDLFYDTYSDFADWKRAIRDEYSEYGSISLPDGWTMWGDNDNFRSVGNFPVQGHGAVIMRLAVNLAQKYKLKVVYTLHDSLTIDYPARDFRCVAALVKCMRLAFESTMKPYGEMVPVMMDAETWSRDYKDGERTGYKNLKVMTEYVDERGAKDLERFRPYIS